jgi:hypothetical protein
VKLKGMPVIVLSARAAVVAEVAKWAWIWSIPRLLRKGANMAA